MEPHVRHALGFAVALGAVPKGLCVDLGSGAGVPGLPLALAWPSSRWLLIEAGSNRVELLEAAVRRLGLEDRVAVEHARAEAVGRRPERRAAAELVVARGFGRPATTAECGAPLLTVAGTLLVSEPPDPEAASEDDVRPEGAERWPEEGVALLGLVPLRRVRVSASEASYRLLRQHSPCPARYPRRDGVPRKRPLW